ncbi:MAG: rod-binding protein [Negativicutes bacterium]|nr:rod-binding protein [Negativicutes bacterium]
MKINGISGEPMLQPQNTTEAKAADADFAAKFKKAAATVQEDKDKARLKAVCQEMEAVYLNLMLSKMRATVPKTNLFGQSSQEDIMRSLLDSELTKNLAKAGGIGIADMLYRQLTMDAKTKKNSQAPD